MKEFDKQFYTNNIEFIAGLDEAGRGPLAGPVCAAAVILPKNIPEILQNEIKDSKKLSAKKREFLYEEIRVLALAYAIEEVDQKVIDKDNILNATKRAMENAVFKLCRTFKKDPQLLLIDGNFKINVHVPQVSIVGGDSKSISIAAASILAKVHRDNLMEALHEEYPHYNLKKNKGYGTAEHCEAIKKYGVSPLHRATFKKVREYIV